MGLCELKSSAKEVRGKWVFIILESTLRVNYPVTLLILWWQTLFPGPYRKETFLFLGDLDVQYSPLMREFENLAISAARLFHRDENLPDRFRWRCGYMMGTELLCHRETRNRWRNRCFFSSSPSKRKLTWAVGASFEKSIGNHLSWADTNSWVVQSPPLGLLKSCGLPDFETPQKVYCYIWIWGAKSYTRTGVAGLKDPTYPCTCVLDLEIHIQLS